MGAESALRARWARKCATDSKSGRYWSTMRTRDLVPVLLALPLSLTSVACPTRPGPGAAGSGGASVDGAIGGAGGLGAGNEAGGSGRTAGIAGADDAGGAAGAGGGDQAGGAVGEGGAGTGGIGGAAGGGGGPSCNPACDSTHRCVDQECLLVDGIACTLASQCASNVCAPFYQDSDGDGYGTGAPTGFCGSAAPVGYAAQGGDCCDDSSHLALAKLIHPGADFQMTSAGGICNVTWDYNCSGAIEKYTQKLTACTGTPASGCKPVYSDFADSDCGTQAIPPAACTPLSGSCQLTQVGSTFEVLSCR